MIKIIIKVKLSEFNYFIFNWNLNAKHVFKNLFKYLPIIWGFVKKLWLQLNWPLFVFFKITPGILRQE